MFATGGLYAPTIRHHNGTFFVVCTNVVRDDTDGSGYGLRNFIVSTTDIHAGRWSEPVFFDFDGIDTSLYFAADGKTWVTGSKSPGPMTKIMLFEIDITTGAKLTDEKELWSGTGGIYPEGPHIYLKNGFFYLLISEGGTHEGHKVTMARSRDIEGPYEASPLNPILTAAGTDEYVQCTGHCEAFEDKTGEWWCVCLAIRKGAEQLYGLGRETFLVKGHWNADGWLKFERARTTLSVPGVHVEERKRLTAVPGVDLLYIRDPDLSRYNLPSTSENKYELTASPHALSAPDSSPTFLGKRQRRMDGTSSAVLHPTPTNTQISAGLAVYKDEHRFLLLSHSSPSNKIVFQTFNKARQIDRSVEYQLDAAPESVRFVFEYTEFEYVASFGVDGGESVELGRVDAVELSGKDFVGPIIGVFAINIGDLGEKTRFTEFVVDNTTR
jgi:beta-xylosidase